MTSVAALTSAVERKTMSASSFAESFGQFAAPWRPMMRRWRRAKPSSQRPTFFS